MRHHLYVDTHLDSCHYCNGHVWKFKESYFDTLTVSQCGSYYRSATGGSLCYSTIDCMFCSEKCSLINLSSIIITGVEAVSHLFFL